MHATQTHERSLVLVACPRDETAADVDRTPRAAAAVTAGLTAVAVAAFAANALLARLALTTSPIDPAGYTSIRLLSTGIVLGAFGLAMPKRRSGPMKVEGSGGWLSPILLLVSTLTSVAGLARLTASTGALIFFVVAQATMSGAGLIRGERPTRLQWLGMLAALAGLAWMLAPGARGPSPEGAALVVVAGVSWGLYSLRGRAAADAVAVTRQNYLWCLPVAAPAVALLLPSLELSWHLLAAPVLSGAVASSVGSVMWYAAARRLSATRAATVQLSVPVLSALGGVLVLGEPASARLLLAGVLVLAGAAVAVAGKNPQPSR
jgi:drug/metabolite transporter (DMT)-like permease